MTHSPLPWHKSDSLDYGPMTRVVRASNGVVVAVLPNSHAGESIEDRQSLIAAAPELLEALYAALIYVEDVIDNKEALACFKKGVVQKHAKQIRDAIAKAEGQA